MENCLHVFRRADFWCVKEGQSKSKIQNSDKRRKRDAMNFATNYKKKYQKEKQIRSIYIHHQDTYIVEQKIN
jgi:hypothetical protein